MLPLQEPSEELSSIPHPSHKGKEGRTFWRLSLASYVSSCIQSCGLALFTHYNCQHRRLHSFLMGLEIQLGVSVWKLMFRESLGLRLQQILLRGATRFLMSPCQHAAVLAHFLEACKGSPIRTKSDDLHRASKQAVTDLGCLQTV